MFMSSDTSKKSVTPEQPLEESGIAPGSLKIQIGIYGSNGREQSKMNIVPVPRTGRETSKIQVSRSWKSEFSRSPHG
jgi:hypothetical protein